MSLSSDMATSPLLQIFAPNFLEAFDLGALRMPRGPSLFGYPCPLLFFSFPVLLFSDDFRSLGLTRFSLGGVSPAPASGDRVNSAIPIPETFVFHLQFLSHNFPFPFFPLCMQIQPFPTRFSSSFR